MCKKASAFGGLRLPDPLPGLCLWTPLGDFRPPNLLIGQCLLASLILGLSVGILPYFFQKSPPPQKKEKNRRDRRTRGTNSWHEFVPLVLAG